MTVAHAALTFALAATAGCATLPPIDHWPPSHSFPDTAGTTLGRLLDGACAAHPGDSGIAPLDDGRDAMAVRLALIDLAERSIDVQTFILGDDATTALLWHHILAAARRSVRVRVLVDDIGLQDGTAEAIARTNVEVRVFNPRAHRRAFRSWEFLLRFDVLNHRMHNKLFVVDGQALLIGGRNLTDAYYGVDPTADFRDFEVFAAGPVVAQAATAFDTYWNDSHAIPVEALSPAAPERAAARIAFETALPARAADWPWPPDPGDARARVAALRDLLCWGQAKLVWDDPAEKVTDAGPIGDSKPFAAIRALLRETRHEAVIESAYFAPDDRLLDELRAARTAGVGLTVLTNSLNATDQIAVHRTYAQLRPALVHMGVRLFEARADAAARRRRFAPRALHARYRIHSKIAVFDQQSVVVGSFNLDHRSPHLNTEVVLVARSPALATWVLNLVAPDFAGDSAWRLEPGRGDGVVWTGLVDGRRWSSGFEPASLGRELLVLLLALIPIGGET